MRRPTKGQGFTLTEILIVVVILGVLAAVITPRFFGQMKRAEVAEATQMIGAMRSMALGYMDASGFVPALNESSSNDAWVQFGMSNPNTSSGLWTYRVSPGAGGADLFAIYTADGFGSVDSYGVSTGPPTYMNLHIAPDGSETWSCTEPAMQPVFSDSSNSTKIGCKF